MVEINRVWCMPNKNTFDIKPVKELIERYLNILPPNATIIDPFANKNQLATITNDLDPQYNTTYNMDATEFLKIMQTNSADMVLYDPPFSARQVSEAYKKFDMSVNMETTQASYWSKQKEQIGRVVKEGGYVITCGWNSGGIGKKYGFEIVEILLVPHGGWHNDTIIVVEKKV
jgi:DNA modification methylase